MPPIERDARASTERLWVIACGYEPEQSGRGRDDGSYDTDRRAVDLAVLAAQEGREINWWPMWRKARPGDLMLFRLAEHRGVPVDEEVRSLARKYAAVSEVPAIDHAGLRGEGELVLEEPGYHGIAVITGGQRDWVYDDGSQVATASVSGCLLFPRTLTDAQLREAVPNEPATDVGSRVPCAERTEEAALLGTRAGEALLDLLETGHFFPAGSADVASAVGQLRAFARALRGGVAPADARLLLPPRKWVQDAPKPLVGRAPTPFVAVPLDDGRLKVQPFSPAPRNHNTGHHYMGALGDHLDSALGSDECGKASALLVAAYGWDAAEIASVVRAKFPGHALEETRLGAEPGRDELDHALFASPALGAGGPALLVVSVPARAYGFEEGRQVQTWLLDPGSVERAWQQGRAWWLATSAVRAEMAALIGGQDPAAALIDAESAREALGNWVSDQKDATRDDAGIQRGERAAQALFNVDIRLAGLPSRTDDADLLDEYRALPARLTRALDPFGTRSGAPAAAGQTAQRWMAAMIRSRQQTRETADSAARLFAAISAAQTQKLLTRTEDARRGVIVAGVVTLLLAGVALVMATAAIPGPKDARHVNIGFVGAVVIASVLGAILVAVAFTALAEREPGPSWVRRLAYGLACLALGFAVLRWTGGPDADWAIWTSLGVLTLAVLAGANSTRLEPGLSHTRGDGPKT